MNNQINKLDSKMHIVEEISYWMGGSNGMLNGFTSDLVDQSKRRVTIFILHPGTPFLILVPMLQQQNQKIKNTNQSQTLKHKTLKRSTNNL